MILSGEESSNKRIKCLEAGADDFMVKPFNPAELEARIKMVLRRAGKAIFNGGGRDQRADWATHHSHDRLWWLYTTYLFENCRFDGMRLVYFDNGLKLAQTWTEQHLEIVAIISNSEILSNGGLALIETLKIYRCQAYLFSGCKVLQSEFKDPGPYSRHFRCIPAAYASSPGRKTY